MHVCIHPIDCLAEREVVEDEDEDAAIGILAPRLSRRRRLEVIDNSSGASNAAAEERVARCR